MEIKFRGFLNGNMISPVFDNGKWFEDWRAYEDGVEFEAPIMQYTGLHDKNRKEIYEGDIVITPDCLDVMDDWIVTYSDECCAFMLQSPQNDTYFESLSDYLDDIKIIGNIYENPELLNESSI